MNCAPTLTAEEFRTVHNAVCDLDSICHQLEDVLNSELYLKLVKARNQIRNGLSGAYDQDDRAFSRKSRHYDAVKSELGLRHSEWSIYEVDNLSDSHTFPGARTVTYRDHWGNSGERVVAINGSTWAAIWVAADAAIRDSGDQHHAYIEQFDAVGDTLVLRTGS